MAHASLDSGGMGRTVWRRMMEDVKWLSEKWGLPILILLVTVIAGIICLGKLHTEEKKVAEEVWEPPVEIEDSETVTSIYQYIQNKYYRTISFEIISPFSRLTLNRLP